MATNANAGNWQITGERPDTALLVSVLVNQVKRRRLQQQPEETDDSEELQAESPRQKRRQYWVHPINYVRPWRGFFAELYHELRHDPAKFAEFVRMPPEAFDVLVEHMGPHLLHQDTNMRKALSPTERLVITLRFLATGESFASLHLQFRVGQSTISGIVRSTCHLIWQHLQPIAMPSPTQENWLQAAAGFQSVANFPNCIGAVDGKHVRVQKPPHSGSLYFNYKKYFSVVLMAVADATYRFIAIEVGAYGSTGDSRALLSSVLGRTVLLDQVTLPPPRPLPGTTHPVPFVMVGDEAFPLLENLLRPFPRSRLDARKRVFNMRLSRARRFVECAFGLMSNKWRVFTCALQLPPDTVDMVIKAACRADNAAVQVRAAFADYFMRSEGAVPRHFSRLSADQPDPD
ncbi:uncharacterized protein RB166_003143 [Leptodactylus fuscus]